MHEGVSPMKKFDPNFLQEMKKKLSVELLGVASIEASSSKQLKDQAASLLPGAKSVVVFGKEIAKEVVALLRPSKETGEADPGELMGPHSDYLNSRLTRAAYDLGEIFRAEGNHSLILPAAGCPVDQRSVTAIFSYKHAAELAGLGTIGRHSLLITSQYGPRVRLACLLTDAPLEATPASKKEFCINCDACIRACPVKAFQVPKADQAYAMDKFACRNYRQAGLYCSVCMKVCDEALGV
jgi:epoxyqueuosine reductase